MPTSESADGRVVDWLLASKTPSIRYLAHIHLGGVKEDDAEIIKTRAQITATGPAAYILTQQSPEGYWKYKPHYYSPKFTSSHWSMLMLCELGLDPQHHGMQAGSQHMLKAVEKGYFHYPDGDQQGLGCFWGNWLYYQLYCGHFSDDRVQMIIQFLLKDLNRDCACPYNDGLPCAWGVARALFGLTLLAPELRKGRIQSTIEAGIDFLINRYRLGSADYPYVHKIHPVWTKISFPLYYQADKLFILRILKVFQALHLPTVQEARNQLFARRTGNGIWRGSSPFRSRSWPFLSEGDSVDQWVTLHALTVLS